MEEDGKNVTIAAICELKYSSGLSKEPKKIWKQQDTDTRITKLKQEQKTSSIRIC